ncbi:hypothetical protein GJ633_16635 [Halorubrum sp. CBA1125]|uniref:hypothetical protein n=1 Tax=Halorubrum sp. CBA1125 TaxID=2668072 RepID=UPI0012E8153E|nr:hypothetical protein [Halorubrum sp. CBA1125]MUW16031.1 hypothetical protein [Halorubrum sp. CBA1125]
MTDERPDDAAAPDRDESNPDQTTDAPETRPMTDTPTETDTSAEQPTPSERATNGEPATTDGGPDEPATESAPTGDEPTGTQTADSDSRLGRLSAGDLRAVLDRVGLAALVLLALIAGWGFYSQTGTAIRTWLDPAYQPLALAAFNLAVLLVALAGITHQLYRIRNSDA